MVFCYFVIVIYSDMFSLLRNDKEISLGPLAGLLFPVLKAFHPYFIKCFHIFVVLLYTREQRKSAPGKITTIILNRQVHVVWVAFCFPRRGFEMAQEMQSTKGHGEL